MQTLFCLSGKLCNLLSGENVYLDLKVVFLFYVKYTLAHKIVFLLSGENQSCFQWNINLDTKAVSMSSGGFRFGHKVVFFLSIKYKPRHKSGSLFPGKIQIWTKVVLLLLDEIEKCTQKLSPCYQVKCKPRHKSCLLVIWWNTHLLLSEIHACYQVKYTLVIKWNTNSLSGEIHTCSQMKYKLVIRWNTHLLSSEIQTCYQVKYTLVTKWNTNLLSAEIHTCYQVK